jgi:hypothetical protein
LEKWVTQKLKAKRRTKLWQFAVTGSGGVPCWITCVRTYYSRWTLTWLQKIVFASWASPRRKSELIEKQRRTQLFLLYEFKSKVASCVNWRNIKKSYVLPTDCIWCVLYGSRMKTETFRPLPHWMQPRRSVFTARYGLI